MNPTPRFVQSIQANLRYWQQRITLADPVDISKLDREKENLYQAVQFGLCVASTQALATKLALDLFDLVDQGGYWQDWIPILEQAVHQTDVVNPLDAAKVRHRLGQLYRRQYRLDQACQEHEAALVIARQLADEFLIAEACLNLGLVYNEQRNYAKAGEMGLAALDGFTRTGADPYWMAHAYTLLGLVEQAFGHWATSQQYLAQTVALWQELVHPLELAKALLMLANTCLYNRQYQEAEPLYLEAEALLAGVHSEHDKIHLLISLGTLYANTRRLLDAEAAFRRADLAYLEETGQKYQLAVLLLNLGDVLLEQGKPEEAEPLLRLSLERFLELEERFNAGNVAGTLAAALFAQGDVAAARHYYAQAIQFLDQFPEMAFARHLRQKFAAALSQT
ncbi:MAG: hypothetical protein Fur0021_12290 [Candidatus Promineifilaceae bacterium]